MASDLPTLQHSWWGAIPFSSHGKTYVITETTGYFWSTGFCEGPVEVAYASRGIGDCRRPGKEELEEPTSPCPWRTQRKSTAFPVVPPAGAWNERGQELWAAQAVAVTSEENLHPEKVGDHNPEWRRTLPPSLWVSCHMRGDPGWVEHCSKTPPHLQCRIY